MWLSVACSATWICPTAEPQRWVPTHKRRPGRSDGTDDFRTDSTPATAGSMDMEMVRKEPLR